MYVFQCSIDTSSVLGEMAHSVQDQSIITTLDRMQVVIYVDVASATVLLYDYILTLNAEVSLIWHSSWNTTKVLFLLTRYMPFISITIVLYQAFALKMSPSACKVVYQWSGWLVVVGIGLAEIILTVRTWAVWGRDRRLTIGLPIFFIVIWALIFPIMGIFLDSITLGPPIQGFRGCFVTGGSPILSLCWVLLMTYQAGILTLMMIRGATAYRSGGDSALFNVVHRDGILYYFFLFAVSGLGLVVILTLPRDFANLLATPQRVIHAILTSRVIIDIREQASTNQVYSNGLMRAGTFGKPIRLSTMVFLKDRRNTHDSETENTFVLDTSAHFTN